MEIPLKMDFELVKLLAIPCQLHPNNSPSAEDKICRPLNSWRRFKFTVVRQYLVLQRKGSQQFFSFPKLQLSQTSAFPNWLLAEAGLCGQEGRMFLEEPNPSAARRDQMGDQPLPRWTEKLGTKKGETKPSCSMVLEYLPTCSPKTTQM